jgi:flavin reductase (DIM6/NTAB) family NADH-FMN oxidoreductase RutF
MPVPEKTIDTVAAQAFREAMGHLASGVTIITASLDGAPVGMTATAVCSVSAKPPMLLVSLTTGSRTALGVEQCKAFAVHLLGDHSQKHAEQFAAAGDHFAGIKYRCDEQTKVPVLHEVLAHFVCLVERTVEIADHMLFVGRVVECEVKAPGRHPLVYFDRKYRKVAAAESQPVSLEPWGSTHDFGLPGWGLPT